MEQISTKEQKYNIRLFPIYKMFAWDLLFYFSISFLFLNQVKGISVANILFADSFYPVFKFIFQIPCVCMIDKFGKQKNMIAGNLFVGFSILILIFGTGMQSLILSNFVMALGFVLKSLTEPNILYSFIPRSTKRGSIFSKIDGKGSSYWYYFDAISSISTGFLFVINGYLPMVMSFVFCMISALLAYRFKPIPNSSNINSSSNKNSFKEQISDLKSSFKYIFKSTRLKSLIMFSGLFSGLLGILSTLRSSLLTDLNVPEQYFGIIFAGLQFISAISTANQNYFHNRYRNRTLSHFSIPHSLSLIGCGIIVAIGIRFQLAILLIFLLFAVQYIVKGPYHTLITRYLSNFSNSNIRTKIYSANSLLENIFRALTSLFASFLLTFTTTDYTLIIIGCIFTVLFIFTLDYMKDRVGLKPEEYKKSDILAEIK